MPGKNSSAQALSPYIDSGQRAGAATLAWRNGEICDLATVGRRNLVSGVPSNATRSSALRR